MNTNWKKLTWASAVGAVCSLVVWIGTTTAKEETSVLVNKPAETTTDIAGPTLPPPQNPNETSHAPNSNTDLFAPSTRAPVTPEALPIPPQTSSQAVKRPFMRPAEPREPKGKLVGEEPMPLLPPQGATPQVTLPPPEGELPQSAVVPSAPVPSGINVKPTPPIDYDTHHDARKMLRAGQLNIVVLTKDPSEGCFYQIPLTVPSCCAGEPRVSGGRGLLGRGIVEYEWPCGFKAKIKFRHVLGDVKVDYEAD
jgi:hypothetical protein